MVGVNIRRKPVNNFAGLLLEIGLRYAAPTMRRHCIPAILIFGILYLASHDTICLASDNTSTITTSTQPAKKTARHRLDLTTLFLDEIDTNSATLIFGYTYNLNAKSNLSFALPYQDADTGRTGDSGIGDLIITFSYIPSISLSANPWVPKAVGSGVSLLLPTADSDRMENPDATIVTPFIGFVFPILSDFAVYPSLAYTHSLERTAIGTDVRLVTAEVDMTYVSPHAFWVSYAPAIIRDLEIDDTAVNHRLTIRKKDHPTFRLQPELLRHRPRKLYD